MLDAGANPNVLDYKGDTPLIVACRNGNKSVVLKLLQHKANPNLQGKNGWTALMYAIKFKQLAIVKILTDHDARSSS